MTLLAGLTFLGSCNNDDGGDGPGIANPTVTPPASAVNVQEGMSVNITFSVTTPGEYASASASATNGSASISSEPADGATTGNVVVSFTADGTTGAGAVELTVTDDEGNTGSGVATIDIQSGTVTNEVDVTPSASGVGTTTWTADNIYNLRGFIFVNSGQTLTIEAGTVIKGQPGQGSSASALIVSRGGTIIAEGTADNPIIFTSTSDDLNGSVADDASALWGGLIVLGNATTNNQDSPQKQVEGITDEGDRGLYGGSDDADNSGVLKYVSIRHGGSLIGDSNEINGLTLGAVGNGTTIENIEVWSNLDDGIEFFGGTVNVKNAAVSWAGDDAIDYDEGFRGKLQNVFVWDRSSDIESDDPRGGEHDGGVSANERLEPFAIPMFYNATFIYSDDEGSAVNMSNTILFRDNAGGKYFNSIFYGYDAPVTVEDLSSANNPDSYTRFSQDDLEFSNNILYDVNGVVDNSNIQDIFTLSGEPEAGNEATWKSYGESNNMVVDPGFGSGGNTVVPTASEVTSDLAALPGDDTDGFFTDQQYKGAFDPNGTPWIANWTKAWEVLNQ